MSTFTFSKDRINHCRWTKWLPRSLFMTRRAPSWRKTRRLSRPTVSGTSPKLTPSRTSRTQCFSHSKSFKFQVLAIIKWPEGGGRNTACCPKPASASASCIIFTPRTKWGPRFSVCTRESTKLGLVQVIRKKNPTKNNNSKKNESLSVVFFLSKCSSRIFQTAT